MKRAGKKEGGWGEGIFAREPSGFPARPAKRGGHWILSRISDKMSSNEVVNILKRRRMAYEVSDSSKKRTIIPHQEHHPG